MACAQEDGTVLLTDEVNGKKVEVRRRLSTLMNNDSLRAFSEVSKALELNLSHLCVEDSLHKKMLAENFNRWLQDRSQKGVFSLVNKNLSQAPCFLPGLHFDCVGLEFQFNQLETLDNIQGLTRLRFLDLSHNRLSASNCLPEDLIEFTSLERLSLGDNNLQEIPDVVFKLKELRWLDVQDNMIDYVPEDLCALEKLVILDLQHNEIAYLPHKISDLFNLTTLLLNGNILLEPLPDCLFSMKNLKNLHLRGCALDSFPSGLCNMEQLKTLDVSHNSILSLPDEIGKLVHVEVFDISYNKITKLPESFGWMISLNEFRWQGKVKQFENVPEKSHKNVQSIRLYFRNLIRKEPEQRARFFDEIECPNNIRKKTDQLNEQKEEQDLVLGGTIEKLVQMLTHESYSSLNYTRCFLLLYQSFCSSEEFLSLLILRYNSCTPTETEDGGDVAKQKIIRIRVLNTLTKWIETHWHHFYKDLIRQIGAFVATLPDSEGRKLRKAHQKLVDGSIKDNSKKHVVTHKQKPPKPILPSSASFPITSIDPKELARQVSLMEHDFLSKIQPEEFLNANRTSAEKAEKAPNLTRHIQYFNRFSAVVTSSILKYKDTKQRVQALSLFLLVAEECRLLNNFNTVIEIVAALQSTPIHRLKITWKLVSNKLKTIWEGLQELTGIEENSKTYRRALKDAASQPRVPNIGVILKDLTFLHDGNPDVLGDNPELINFGKLRHLEGIIEQIQHYQRTPYNFERVVPIQKVIMTTEVWDDVQAYNESLICEDREGKTPAMRGEIVAEHNDTIVNLDLNLTPEQLELAEKSRSKWQDKQLQLGLSTGTEVSKSGHLMMREDSAWKRMWFSMQFPSLYYYASETDQRPTGVIKLQGSNVEKIGKKKHFAIVISHPTSRPYALRGDNDKISISWYNELCKLVK